MLNHALNQCDCRRAIGPLRVAELRTELNRELHTTLVLVTHDPGLAAHARTTLRLRDGAVVPPDASP